MSLLIVCQPTQHQLSLMLLFHSQITKEQLDLDLLLSFLLCNSLSYLLFFSLPSFKLKKIIKCLQLRRVLIDSQLFIAFGRLMNLETFTDIMVWDDYQSNALEVKCEKFDVSGWHQWSITLHTFYIPTPKRFKLYYNIS